jgi:4-alpha-glucanotransferase
MTFGLISWLKKQYPDLNYEVPLWYPSKDQPDQREWLVTNGLGGYSSSTVSGAHRRRYHGLLVSALSPPTDRHVILSRVEEVATIDGATYELATNHWASGVVSPTGYKYLESFTILPAPTWVYELDGHYLIKQLTLGWHTDTLQIGYHWLPDPERNVGEARLKLRFLTGYRRFHDQIEGSSDDRYPQFVSPNHSIIILNESARRLCLTWSDGSYEAQRQWWWDFQWPEETVRALPDREDLYLLGDVTSDLIADQQLSIAATLDKPIDSPDCRAAVATNIERSRKLLQQANFPRPQQKIELLALSCDQYLVSDKADDTGDLYVMEGYPWFNESGRAAMIGLPGLTLSTRRFADAKRILETYAKRMVNGMLPNRLLEDENVAPDRRLEYGAADITLWWAWALHHYLKTTRDIDMIRRQLPLLLEAAKHYTRGTASGIKVDSADGLLRCSRAQHEFTWMDTRVAGIPITPRSGKAVEICALWYNFIKTALFFAQSVSLKDPFIEELQHLSELCGGSMQKFWNADLQCLFDVIEPGPNHHGMPVQTVRPNQIFAVSLPHRAFSIQQEKAILVAVEAELLTPQGMRSLAPTDPGYQGAFGCGFSHADQYHRDLSYHNGMGWPWLLGAYCDALVNVYGVLPETTSRIALILQPLTAHMIDEAGLGSISEIFDGSRPHLPRGCFAHALAMAETMRWLNWQLRR